MSQSETKYIVRLEQPLPEERRNTVAIALASDLKTRPEKMHKLLARGGRISRGMSLSKAKHLRTIFQRYHVAVVMEAENEASDAIRQPVGQAEGKTAQPASQEHKTRQDHAQEQHPEEQHLENEHPQQQPVPSRENGERTPPIDNTVTTAFDTEKDSIKQDPSHFSRAMAAQDTPSTATNAINVDITSLETTPATTPQTKEKRTPSPTTDFAAFEPFETHTTSQKAASSIVNTTDVNTTEKSSREAQGNITDDIRSNDIPQPLNSRLEPTARNTDENDARLTPSPARATRSAQASSPRQRDFHTEISDATVRQVRQEAARETIQDTRPATEPIHPEARPWQERGEIPSNLINRPDPERTPWTNKDGTVTEASSRSDVTTPTRALHPQAARAQRADTLRSDTLRASTQREKSEHEAVSRGNAAHRSPFAKDTLEANDAAHRMNAKTPADDTIKPWQRDTQTDHRAVDTTPSRDNARVQDNARGLRGADSTARSSLTANDSNDSVIPIGRGGRAGRDGRNGSGGGNVGRYGAASSASSSFQDLNRIPSEDELQQGYDDVTYGRSSSASHGYDTNSDYNNDYNDGNHQDDYGMEEDTAYLQDEQGNYYKEGERYRNRYASDNDHNATAQRISPSASFIEILSLAFNNVNGIKRYWIGIIVPLAATEFLLLARAPLGLNFTILFLSLIFVQVGWQRIALKKIFGRQTSWKDFLNFNANFIQYIPFLIIAFIIGILQSFIIPAIATILVFGFITIPLAFAISYLWLPFYYLFVCFASYNILYRKSNGFSALGQGFMSGLEQYKRMLPAAILTAITFFIMQSLDRVLGDSLMGMSIYLIIFTAALSFLLPIFYMFVAMLYLQIHERDGDERNIM